MVELIRRGDRKGIDEAITNAKVEKMVLDRLRLKARAYGTDPSIGADAEGKINVDAVVAMYEVGVSHFFVLRPACPSLFRYVAFIKDQRMLFERNRS